MVGMSPDWLARLAPAHAPAPAGWWPPAPGWWTLALLLLLAVGAWSYWFMRPARRFSRAALRELKQLENRPRDDAQMASELEQLLRRYALAIHGHGNVANLSGATWLAFVVAHGGDELAGEAGQNLLSAAYGSRVPTDRDRWLKGARNFLRHRR